MSCRLAWAIAATAAAAFAGCIPNLPPPDQVFLYNLWAENRGPADRYMVLGHGLDGGSSEPALLVPAGQTVSTYSTTIGSQPGAAGAVLVYDPNCDLVGRVVVNAGSYLLTLDGDAATVTELAPGAEPTDAPKARDAPRNCPGGAPP